MKAALKAKWIKALRSGRYKQTHMTAGVIDSRGKESNCCLGVLARVARCKTIDQWGDLVDRVDNQSHTPLPISLLDHDYQTTLAVMNDSGKDFNYIAQYIEDFL